MLTWDLMLVRGHAWGAFVPFYIDWLDCPHPSETCPVVGALTEFRLTLPSGHGLGQLLDAPERVRIHTGPARLRAVFQSPNAQTTYEADSLATFQM